MGDELAGILDFPDEGWPDAFLIFAHAFTAGKHIGSMSNINRVLCGSGLAILRFDFTGIGQSGGEFSATNFTTNVEDLLLASDFLEQAYSAPTLLLGHSFGGLASIAAADRIDSVEAVATIGTPPEPANVLRHFPGIREQIAQQGPGEIELGGKVFTLTQQFLDDADSYEQPARQLTKPLMVLQSPEDETVPWELGEQLFEQAGGPKSLIPLDGINHLMTKKAHAEHVGKLIAAWAGNFIKKESPDFHA